MIKITFPDGSVKEFQKGITALEVANSISVSLVKKCLAAKLNGELKDLKAPIEEDASIELITGDVKTVVNRLVATAKERILLYCDSTSAAKAKEL
jgi:threonyl-tRNA synthetase